MNEEAVKAAYRARYDELQEKVDGGNRVILRVEAIKVKAVASQDSMNHDEKKLMQLILKEEYGTSAKPDNAKPKKGPKQESGAEVNAGGAPPPNPEEEKEQKDEQQQQPSKKEEEQGAKPMGRKKPGDNDGGAPAPENLKDKPNTGSKGATDPEQKRTPDYGEVDLGKLMTAVNAIGETVELLVEKVERMEASQANTDEAVMASLTLAYYMFTNIVDRDMYDKPLGTILKDYYLPGAEDEGTDSGN